MFIKSLKMVSLCGSGQSSQCGDLTLLELHHCPPSIRFRSMHCDSLWICGFMCLSALRQWPHLPSSYSERFPIEQAKMSFLLLKKFTLESWFSLWSCSQLPTHIKFRDCGLNCCYILFLQKHSLTPCCHSCLPFSFSF